LAGFSALASRVGWKLRPQDSIELEQFKIVDGKYACSSRGSKLRTMVFLRVMVPETKEDPRLDYSAALRTTLQQQRLRGMFEGLRRASIPFVYTVLMKEADNSPESAPVLEFDLVVGTWAEGNQKDGDGLSDSVEQRATILAATLGVALPNATVVRLARNDLAAFLKSLLLPGVRELPQEGPPMVGGELCSFEEKGPLAAPVQHVPEFYIPNFAESGRDGILLGAVESSGGDLHQFRLQLEDLKRHVVVLGMTGSGKSTTGATIVKQVAEFGLPVTVFDWHDEYGGVIADAGGRVVSPGKDEFAVNPLEVGPGTDLVEDIAMVSDIFSDIYHFTHPQAYMFRNALQKRMSETGQEEVPNLTSLVRTIESYPLRSAYDNETKVALLRRLAPLTQGQAGKALGGSGGVKMEDLLGGSFCVQLGQLRDVQTRAVFTDVMLKLIYEEKVRRKAPLDHMTVIEEARNVAPARRPEDPPSVGERMISELRKFGEAMMFVAQFPSQVASEIVKNSGTRIVHRVAWPDDVALLGESMALDNRQKEYLTKLAVGEAVVGVARVQRPILVKVRGDAVMLGGEQRPQPAR
jgi:Helicase HerA, central domain